MIYYFCTNLSVMKFSQRLAYYLFGVLIGGMFLIFLFGEKKTRFCYFPNCRVLQDLRSKPMLYSDQVEIALGDSLVQVKDIRNCLHYGKVDFSQSNKEFQKGKIYVIKGKNTDNEPLELQVINYSDKIILHKIIKK